mmetsp:Transcript_18722/g.24461  ORF Transcript_18722/g.24461 Transcript_18722/m.24461 type:complete len:182 (+) Transcript_18722:184-729(+)
MEAKIKWKVFFDLQCPYSKACWKNIPAIRKEFADTHDIEIHLTSLVFHAQAFTAQCAANLIEGYVGAEARTAFQDECFAQQDNFTNAALGDCKKSDVDNLMAAIAEDAGVYDKKFTKEKFLEKLHDWEESVKPAFIEHKHALQYGVYGTPKHVIDDKLMNETESAWGVNEWRDYLAKNSLV